MYEEARRHAAIDLAIATRGPAATAPIVLAQEGPDGHKLGFLLYAPVIDPGGTVKGLVYAAYNGENFIAAGEFRLAVKPQFLSIEDVTDNKATQISAIGKRADSQRFKNVSVNFGGRQWRVTAGIESSSVLAQPTRWICLHRPDHRRPGTDAGAAICECGHRGAQVLRMAGQPAASALIR